MQEDDVISGVIYYTTTCFHVIFYKLVDYSLFIFSIFQIDYS